MDAEPPPSGHGDAPDADAPDADAPDADAPNADARHADARHADVSYAWLSEFPFANPMRARAELESIAELGVPDELVELLLRHLRTDLKRVDDVDGAVKNLVRFIASSRSPTAVLSLFERDPSSLQALLQTLAVSPGLADQLIADPESFDLLRTTDGQPAPRHFLVDELQSELDAIDRPERAADAIAKFVDREVLRIAYGEFVRELSPDVVGRQLAYVADATLEAALAHVVRDHARRGAEPDRADGSTPRFVVIGLGALGGEELGYAEPLKLVVLCDQIDRGNVGHVAYYESIVGGLIRLLWPDDGASGGIPVDLSQQPDSIAARVFGLDEATAFYEGSNRVWQRMGFVKARVCAGDRELGDEFLQRLEPWVYRAYLSRTDLGEIHALRLNLERRAERIDAAGDNVDNDPGGRRDVELTVQFLQLLHGRDVADVRRANTHDAIVALEQAGCITHQEATLLGENYARLSRLGHQLSMIVGRAASLRAAATGDGVTGAIPAHAELRRRLAWRLGIREPLGRSGDAERFEKLLRQTFRINRRIINHLMVDTTDDEEAAIETELLLTPAADRSLVRSVLPRYGFDDAERAMEALTLLGRESVPFLSERRCRHFLALLAPALLTEISRTPYPPDTLRSLVRVTDSLGAKATLWELFRANPPTMRLMVRLCAAAPYLSGILIRHPGMIDELIDSLVINALPSAQRLDAQSIELCRGAKDLSPILLSFKNCAHLTIGVREILGKDPIEATHRALSDTAEACLRRIVEHEQEKLASQFGDPADDAGRPAHFVIVALGKLGGREPNYHSDLDVVFLYTADGRTRRRVGGPRSTMSNRDFFDRLAEQVVATVSASGPLYELDSRLRMMGDDQHPSAPLEAFLSRFRHGIAPMWQRMAICKARCFVGPRVIRGRINRELGEIVRQPNWRPAMVAEIRELRLRLQESAAPSNLKRGEGGTLDVEMIAQMLMLRHAGEIGTGPQPGSPRQPEIPRHTGTTASLQALADAGVIPEPKALTLIGNYRVLRRIEANLRLMDTPERHQFPDGERERRNLAFLMNERDPDMILAQCQNARRSNRRLFDEFVGGS